MADTSSRIVCTVAEEDTSLLDELRGDAVSVVYVGTIESDGVYKDVYLVLLRDRTMLIVEVRKTCFTEARVST